MRCISCHHPLVNVRESHFFMHLTYDVCDLCGGMWLDKGELDRIADRTSVSVEGISLDKFKRESRGKQKPYQPFPPKCLRCSDKTMVKVHFMGEAKILLDVCEECGGLWIDGGELNKINQFIHWYDKSAKPSRFGRFLHHAHSSFFHRIDVTRPFESTPTLPYS